MVVSSRTADHALICKESAQGSLDLCIHMLSLSHSFFSVKAAKGCKEVSCGHGFVTSISPYLEHGRTLVSSGV